ncbi:site-specific integrase [Desulfotomaculum defluvii]
MQPIRDKKKIEAMKKILKAGSLRDYALFTLGINSGLRISDLLKLKVSDVLEGKKIRDRIIIREQKTGKAKDFPLGKTAKKSLEEHLASWTHQPEDFLFRSRKGKGALTRQQAYNIINNAAHAVGIQENIGTHTLRKTFGYHAYKQGTDLTLIQKLLNHSAPSVTLRYIGITQDQLDEVYLTLEL